MGQESSLQQRLNWASRLWGPGIVVLFMNLIYVYNRHCFVYNTINCYVYNVNYYVFNE